MGRGSRSGAGKEEEGEDAVDDARAPDRTASAESGSDFSDHASHEGAQEVEERPAAAGGKPGLFGRFGFGKKTPAETESASAGVGLRNLEAPPSDDEEERPDSPDEGVDEEDGAKAIGGLERVNLGDATPPDPDAEKNAADHTPKQGLLGMLRSLFGRKAEVGTAQDERASNSSDSSDVPVTKFGKISSLSPRKEQPKSPSKAATKSAVQMAVERSFFVRAGRLLRAVFRPDSLFQTGKEGNIDLSKIADANQYSIRGLQQRVYRMQWIVMLLAVLGVLNGIAVNEWCWLGYIPTPEEEMGYCSGPGITAIECRDNGGMWVDGYPNPLQREDGQRCRNPDDSNTYFLGLLAKSTCSALTGMLLMAIFHLYECIAIELCFRNHLEYHREFVDVPFWNMGLLPEFLLEVLVCIVHPGPRVHFNMSVEARGRVAVYNSESFLVSLMFLRGYAVWRYYREWMFMRYTSKNFASRLSDVAMDSKLAIKAILADVPFQTIVFTFFLMTFVLAYLVRIAEAPANIAQMYFWNQLWLIVTTATSTGYGDLAPQTHLGRFVCIIAMLGGIFLTAILITTVSTSLELNAGEHRLMNFLQSEHWEQELKIAASKCIQSWWRRAIFHPRTLAALRTFKNKKKAYRKFLEATPHFGAFVESMRQDTQMVQQQLTQIQNKAVSGIDLSALGNTAKAKPSGIAGLQRGGASAGGPAMGGNPVPSKVFEELMIELAQVRKANMQLKGIIDKGQVSVMSGGGGGGYAGGGGLTTPGRMTPGGIMRTGSNESSMSGAGIGRTQSGGMGANSSRGPAGGGSSYRNRGRGNESQRSGGGTARSGAGGFYGNGDPAIVASRAVEERVKRLELQIKNFDKGMAKCLSQIVRLLQGLY